MALVLKELQNLIRDADPSDLRIMLKSIPDNVLIEFFEDNPEMRYVTNDFTMVYNHAYDFAFEVISAKEDASDVTGEMLRTACIERITRLPTDELLEACGRFDTHEEP